MAKGSPITWDIVNRRRTLWWTALCSIALLSLIVPSRDLAVAETVVRNVAHPLAAHWQPGPWNSATGQVTWVAKDQPPSGVSEPIMELTIHYDGSGFQFFSVEPGGLQVPGKLSKVRVWIKPLQSGYTWLVNFRDGDGKDSVDGKKLEWACNAPAGQWTQIEFSIPANWKQPVKLVSISAHNWNRQQEAGNATLRICNLQVETEMSDVPPADRPLQLRVVSDVVRNVFTEGQPVSFRVICDSWKGQPLSGKLVAEVFDDQGKPLTHVEEQIVLENLYIREVSCKPPRFGPYRLKATAQLEGVRPLEAESRFIYIPKPHDLSAAEKWASPWGLNIHSASGGVSYESLRQLGVVWIRDYSYNRQWLVNARGSDGRYGGWPWYPRINKGIQDSGLMLLACMGESIAPYVQKGLIEPDRQWKYDLVHILWAMPDFPAWELDNEYDYHHGKAEHGRQWQAYHAYHRLFGEIVKFMKPQCLAVEQGTAGVHPEWVERSIKAGAFEKIDVVNAHFYCGIDPPESSVENANGPGEENDVMLIADRLRAFAKAADCDGRDRQAWITEFGWDTRAGYVVSEDEQAYYLQRGYLMGLACGIDKMFWFWDWDNKEVATTYFDGCGLFDYRNEPKPAAAALAALTHLLHNPRVLGSFDLPGDILGYVIRDGEQLWACVFRPEKGANPVEVALPGTEFFDMYGNRLPEKPRQVGVTPIWIRGFQQDEPVVVETGFSWETPQLVPAVGGEPLKLVWSVKNISQKDLRGTWQLELPPGWQVESQTGDFSVSPGETRSYSVSLRIPASPPRGRESIRLLVKSGAAEKSLSATARVVPAAELSVGPLEGAGNNRSVTVRIKNNSSVERSWLLQLSLPAGWVAQPKQIPVTLGPRGEMESRFMVNISSTNPPQSPLRIVLATPDGNTVTEAKMIAPFWSLPEVRGIQVDGELDDWPAKAWLPEWLLGVRGESVPVRLAIGYSQSGVFLALQVEDHDGQVTDPRVFWAQTCLELFVDTLADDKPRKSYQVTDHQFWFCPLLDSGKVFAGRWKRGQEIAETQYDLQDVQGVSRKTKNGWAMEVFLPGSRLHSWDGTRGKNLGANVNLTLPGSAGRTEVYWPTAKSDSAPDRPDLWGRLRLD